MDIPNVKTAIAATLLTLSSISACVQPITPTPVWYHRRDNGIEMRVGQPGNITKIEIFDGRILQSTNGQIEYLEFPDGGFCKYKQGKLDVWGGAYRFSNGSWASSEQLENHCKFYETSK